MQVAYCFRTLSSVICITYSCICFARKMVINLTGYRSTKACYPARRHVSGTNKVQAQNHREIYVGRGLGIIQSNLPLKAGLMSHLQQDARGFVQMSFEVSKDRDAAAFPGNLLVSGHVKFFSFMSNMTSPCGRLCLLSFVLSLCSSEESGSVFAFPLSFRWGLPVSKFCLCLLFSRLNNTIFSVSPHTPRASPL